MRVNGYPITKTLRIVIFRVHSWFISLLARATAQQTTNGHELIANEPRMKEKAVVMDEDKLKHVLILMFRNYKIPEHVREELRQRLFGAAKLSDDVIAADDGA